MANADEDRHADSGGDNGYVARGGGSHAGAVVVSAVVQPKLTNSLPRPPPFTTVVAGSLPVEPNS